MQAFGIVVVSNECLVSVDLSLSYVYEQAKSNRANNFFNFAFLEIYRNSVLFYAIIYGILYRTSLILKYRTVRKPSWNSNKISIQR
jgi:uncharacterized protein with PQ loop repeat